MFVMNLNGIIKRNLHDKLRIDWIMCEYPTYTHFLEFTELKYRLTSRSVDFSEPTPNSFMSRIKYMLDERSFAFSFETVL